MSSLKLPVLLLVLMVSASVAGYTVRPNVKVSQRGPSISLSAIVPTQFGDWKEVKSAGAQVVNPQVQQQLDALYSQILTRTYVNSKGYAVMLSLAYGEDNRGGLQAHRPEVCYPAQGFKLINQFDKPSTTDFGAIDARRLQTSLGPRVEPVTYWIAVAGENAIQRHQKRLAEIKLAITGQVPDGLLFRISSIDSNAPQAFQMHDQFVNELMRSVGAPDRRRLAGLSPQD